MRRPSPLRFTATVWTFLLTIGSVARAGTYYVATNGSDSNPGTQMSPFATFAKGEAVATAGDTIYFRGGTYTFTAGETTCGSSTSTINGVLLDKSGVAGSRINYWAYPGEVPVFDFAGIKDGCRVAGLHVKGSFLHLKGLTVTGVPQNVNTNHESWGLYVNGGSNNIFEQLDLHHNMGPGLFIIKGGNNLVLNCDSHHNYDALSSSGAGSNADGFGCHAKVGDSGNVFRGCRAWWNSDDGWDLISAEELVLVENSWAWHNGYEPDTMKASGNGNGFKIGGYGLPVSDAPPSPPSHTVQRCLAFLNRASGFYANHHPVPNRFYNNTSYNNHPDFNLLGVAADGMSDANMGILRNNIAFGGTLLSNNTGPQVDEANNSWSANVGATITAADFQDLSVTGMDGPRLADGGLPSLANFHLATGSDLIDKGVNLGLPYVGAAPDLGAFEVGDTGGTPDGGAGGADAGRADSGGSGGGGTGAGGSAGAAGTGADGGRADASGMAGRAGNGGVGGSGGSAGASGAGGTDAGATTGAGGSAGASGGGAGAGGAAGTDGAGGRAGASTGGATSGGATTGGCSCNIANSHRDTRWGAIVLLLASVATRRLTHRGRFRRGGLKVPRSLRSAALLVSCGLIAAGCSQSGGTAPDARGGGSGKGGSGGGSGGASSGASGASGSSGNSGASGASSGAGGASSGSGGAAGNGAAGVGGGSGSSGASGAAGSGRGGNDGGRNDGGGSDAGNNDAGGNGGAAGTGQAGAAGSGGSGGSSGAAMIKNDVFWKDTSGNFIYSQGGGVIRAGSTYYWYGVNYGGAATYAANPANQNSDTSFVAITTYSSSDLANWKFEGNALTHASMASKLTMSQSTWIGRVGATYNATTKKYVIVGQYLGTPDTQQFFATSDAPNGAFEVQGTQAVLTNVVNNNCGDQSIFTDDDGQAYIVCSSLEGRSNLYVIPLRPSDFLQAQPATKIFGGAGREGNAMFKYNGRYYACSSDLHGWNASHAYCISATNILGPYSTELVMGNTDLDFSHVTQTGLFVTVKGSSQELVIFGGDRWSDFAGNGIGYNQWMPLTFDGTTPVMQSLSVWSIDAATGMWAVGPGNNYALNPSFEADRVATAPPAGWATTGGADVTDNHSGDFAWQLSGTSNLEQKIANLPNGTYTLSVWIKGTASGALFAKGCGGTDRSIALSGGSAWASVSLTGVAVSGGTCNVGASSTSGTATLDDFTFTHN